MSARQFYSVQQREKHIIPLLFKQDTKREGHCQWRDIAVQSIQRTLHTLTRSISSSSKRPTPSTGSVLHRLTERAATWN